MASTGFLDLPPRSSKPRQAGFTHVLDKGLPLAGMEPLLATLADHVDLWKLGWGTAYLDPAAGDKVAVLAGHDVRACVGGTLLEVAWAQGKAEACLAWAGERGFPCVEVSNGAVGMPLAEKRRLIARAAEGFWVVAEGRESGTVGLYRADGSVREDVVQAVAGAVGPSLLIFEAPAKHQQAWFIRRFGADVGLGNVMPADVLGLEALRLGLRADTVELARTRGAAMTAAGP